MCVCVLAVVAFWISGNKRLTLEMHRLRLDVAQFEKCVWLRAVGKAPHCRRVVQGVPGGASEGSHGCGDFLLDGQSVAAIVPRRCTHEYRNVSFVRWM